MFSVLMMKVAFVWLCMGTLDFPRRTLTNFDVVYSLYPTGLSKEDSHYQGGIQSYNDYHSKI